MDGRVQVEGCDAQFEVSSIGEMNTHVFSGPKTRQVTEIGLSPFMLAFANEGFRDYTLIPVFPLRLFRHKSIFIRKQPRTAADFREILAQLTCGSTKIVLIFFASLFIKQAPSP